MNNIYPSNKINNSEGDWNFFSDIDEKGNQNEILNNKNSSENNILEKKQNKKQNFNIKMKMKKL